MKSQEILQRAKKLRESNQTLQPRSVLDLLMELAQVVEKLEGNAPNRDATSELLDEPMVE
jgi:hypothetical protein